MNADDDANDLRPPTRAASARPSAHQIARVTAHPMDWRRVARLGLLASGGVVAVLLLAGVVLLAVMWPQAPSVERLREVQAARPSVLVSADGQTLAEFSRQQQAPVTLDQVPQHVVDALLATEDARFHQHHGVDVYRTLGAVWRTLGGDTQGGSTLTQQLARNMFPEEIGRQRTLARKAKEWVTALRIERTFSKDEILALYLNSAPFLFNVVGIEMAARTYFDKSASELDVSESATLVGMLKGTHYYNPVVHPERALKRRNVVLAQMQRHGKLDAAQFAALKARPLAVQLTRQPELSDSAPHFAAHLRKWLVDWADEHDVNLYRDGLVIHTTIDAGLQRAATAAVRRQADALQAVADVEWSAAGLRWVSARAEGYLKARDKVQPFAHFWQHKAGLMDTLLRETPEYRQALARGSDDAAALKALRADADWFKRWQQQKTRLQAGFVAIDPRNGEVRAWVGSRGFAEDQFDHVAQAARQPGSTFKPFVYGAALEAGLSPHQAYLDEPVEIVLADRSVWRPTDMSGPSYQPISLRDGLIQSKNIITAQVAQEVGVDRIVAQARSLGIAPERLDPVPSLALGTSPVTLLEMVNAYAGIAQLGQVHTPQLVRRITDRQGRVLAEFAAPARRGMSEASAVELVDMLRGAVDRGTGTQIRTRFGISADVAGKTGTTQNNTDGWFILMHPQLVAGAWVGFNDTRVTMRSSHWGQGGHGALLLVGDFFQAAGKAGAVDAQARFPASRRPPPPPPLEELQPPDEPLLMEVVQTAQGVQSVQTVQTGQTVQTVQAVQTGQTVQTVQTGPSAQGPARVPYLPLSEVLPAGAKAAPPLLHDKPAPPAPLPPPSAPSAPPSAPVRAAGFWAG